MPVTRRKFCQRALASPALALLIKGGSGQALAREATYRLGPNYMLRYLIRTEAAEQQIRDLIAYCRSAHIREVILFTGDNYAMGWGLPTLGEARARFNVLRNVFSELRNAGLTASINMQSTLGHEDFGQDARRRFSWQFMVGDDGAESHVIPCPLDPRWKRYIGQLYGMFAVLEPQIMYIDDDFRYFDHDPVAWGCFCPLHLDAMAKRTGHHLGREDLLHRILTAEPQPTKEREEWLNLCGDSLLEAARIISEAVMKASPRTSMGLMFDDASTFAAEGRRWNELIAVLSVSGNEPVFRPTYASYDGTIYRDVVGQLDWMRKIQPIFGSKTRCTPELENDPYTQFSKSARLMRLQIAISFFVVPPDITLNIFGYTETPWDIVGHTKVLRDSFDYFRGITAWATECHGERGLQILWDDRFPLHRKVAINRMSALPAPRCWEGALDLMGFATTFYPGELKLVSSSFAEERTDDEIRNLLKENLLIDGDTAALLIRRGFGAEIGLKGCEPVEGANYEQIRNRDFGGRFIGSNLLTERAHKYRLVAVERVILVSRMFGPEASFSVPGMMLFENQSGGRIGIIPQSGSRGDLYATDFRSWERQYVLRKMLEWIGKRPLPLFVENTANVLPLRRDGQTSVLLGVANLSGDPMPQVTLQAAWPSKSKPTVQYLTAKGEPVTPDFSAEVGGGFLRMKIPVQIQPLDLGCFRLTYT